MVRTRLAVALLVPPPAAVEVDGVRRALGDRRRTRIAPHITLVPPINVAGDRVDDAVAVVQATARTLAPRGALHLELGPVASFGPDSGIVYLAVHGDAASLGAVDDLPPALRTGPFAREDRHAFVPHVTVADRLAPDAVTAATTLLAGFRLRVTIDRLHLLEHRHDGGGTRWEPVADARFADPVVVGRGGLELELTTGGLIDPAARALIEAASAEGSGPGPEPAGADLLDRFRAEVPCGAEPLVVRAHRRRRLVAVAWGWAHPSLAGEVLGVVVAPDARREGVGGLLRRHLDAQLDAYGQPPGPERG